MSKSKTKEKEITVAQALNELKLLDKKINKKIRQNVFVGVQVAGKPRRNFDPDEAKSSLQSVEDLIAQREKIKGAINASNMKTKVVIGGKKYTVAEAIITKDTMDYKDQLLQKLSHDFASANNEVEMLKNEIQEALDDQLKGIEDKNKIKDFTETYLKLRTPELLDKINLGEYINNLENEIMEFQNEVDYVLSTSNATTTIKL